MASVARLPAVSSWLASEASTPRTELEQPFKKEKIRGLGTRESGGEVNETEKWRRLERHLGEIEEESKGITALDGLSPQAAQIFF